MSFFDRTKEFFGLAPVGIDAIDHEDAYYADEQRHAAVAEPANQAAHSAQGVHVAHSAYATNGSAAYAPREAYAPAVETAPAYEPTIVAVSLVNYNDAMKIGQPYCDGDAVVFELTDADKSHARRLIDFSAGLVLGTGGTMKNLTGKLNTDRRVFAILPHGCTISIAELERAADLR